MRSAIGGNRPQKTLAGGPSIRIMGGLCRAPGGGPHGGENAGMIKVKARGNESVEQMLKRFSKICEKEGLTKDMKRNSYYEKPSDRKRRRARKSFKRPVY